MNGNIVKLVFESVARGSGISSAVKDIDAVRKNLGFASGAAKLLGRTIGGLGGAIGGSVGALLRGNLWELGAMAAGKLVSVIKDHNKLMKDAALAARGLSEGYRSLDKAAEGYQKRVEKWRKAKEDADKAEKEAEETRKKEAEASVEREKARLSFEQKYYDLERQIEDEARKREQLGDDELKRLNAKIATLRKAAELEVNAARGNLSFAKDHGNSYDVSTAEMELKLAREKQKTAEKNVGMMIKEYETAKEKELAEAAAMREREAKERQEEERAKKRTELREREESIREEGEKKILELDKQIEDARKRANVLEENAAKARGVGFGKWARGERDASREAAAEKSAQDKREKQVDSELERLEKTNPRTRTKWQKERINRLREWKADQDPNNNPELKKLKDLEEKKDKLQKEMLSELKEISKQLKAATEI